MGSYGIIKTDGWEKRLYEVLSDWREKPFVWNETDCFRFVLACLEAMHNAPLLDLSDMTYKTAKSGISQMHKRFGAKTISECVGKEFGFEKIGQEKAKRGDIGFINETIGIVDINVIWAMGENGLVWLPIQQGTEFLKVV